MDLVKAMRHRASQLEIQSEKINRELEGLSAALGILDGPQQVPSRRHLTSAGRSAISKAAKKRWANARKQKVGKAWTAERRRKFQETMMRKAAHREKLSRLAKARWRKAKQASKAKAA
jgi:hypothetical protein